MNQKVKHAAVGVVAALTVSIGIGGWYALSVPPVQRLSLPADLIDLASAEGRQLLATSAARTDYDELRLFFVPQQRRAYCGVASGSMVINALLHRQSTITQSTFFSDEASAIRSELAVTLRGLTLSQLAALIGAHGFDVAVVHGSASGADAFRRNARTTLANHSDYLLVNYDRGVLGQAGSGHISPIGAYHTATDRVLVMDVAAHKYPFTWVPVDRLWAAMNTVDSASGKTRGYLIVRSSE